MQAILSVEDIGKSRGKKTVLAKVNLSLATAETAVLSGPSGAGKTTLLRLVAGLEAPDTGRILINGVEVSSAGRVIVQPSERSVTMVFQDLALWPNLTVLQNVTIGLSALQISRKERIERAREALEFCGISAFAKRHPGKLSGGELQRVALARALVPRPKLLLLDEPFVFLDLVLKAKLFDQFQELQRAYGFTALIVTHNPGDAIGIKAARIVVLEDSHICETLESRYLTNENHKSETVRAWRKFVDGTE
jgi:ABC-type sugar transport system ATPase subunit